MGIKVCKFGGTSMADGSTILRGAAIVATWWFLHQVSVLAAI